jgi:hypothetical protein
VVSCGECSTHSEKGVRTEKVIAVRCFDAISIYLCGREEFAPPGYAHKPISPRDDSHQTVKCVLWVWNP